jgi:hypothetical protein
MLMPGAAAALAAAGHEVGLYEARGVKWFDPRKEPFTSAAARAA